MNATPWGFTPPPRSPWLSTPLTCSELSALSPSWAQPGHSHDEGGRLRASGKLSGCSIIVQICEATYLGRPHGKWDSPAALFPPIFLSRLKRGLRLCAKTCVCAFTDSCACPLERFSPSGFWPYGYCSWNFMTWIGNMSLWCVFVFDRLGEKRVAKRETFPVKEENSIRRKLFSNGWKQPFLAKR